MENSSQTTNFSIQEILENFRVMWERQMESVERGQLSPQQIRKLLHDLPRIHEKQLDDLGEKDNFCPICFVPYLTILTEEEMASAMDSPAHPIEELGVTKLSQSWQCGHMFCRRDISKWITSGHASCPMCRRHLVEEATSDRELTAEERAHDEEREEEYRRASAFVISQMSQVQQHMHSARAGSIPEDTIQAFDSNLGLLREAGIPAPRTPPVEDYRREYSGMYS